MWPYFSKDKSNFYSLYIYILYTSFILELVCTTLNPFHLKQFLNFDDYCQHKDISSLDKNGRLHHYQFWSLVQVLTGGSCRSVSYRHLSEGVSSADCLVEKGFLCSKVNIFLISQEHIFLLCFNFLSFVCK